MKRPRLAAVAAALFAAAAGAAHAQQIVYDPSAYAKLIQQAQTGLKQLQTLQAQLEQGRRLYDSFNQASGINSLASVLSSPALRQVLPNASAYVDAAKGDLSALGAIGAQAARIRQANRLYAPAPADPQGAALESAGNRAARDLALGEAAADAGAQRLAGLEQLQGAIDVAPSARAVMDLQARLTAEQAMTANDQMRLQSLAMTEAAETRMAAQRQREQAAAASAARLKMYREAFQ